MRKYTNNNYNKDLKELARQKRKNSTKGEIILWKNILSRKQTGYKFLRQRSIDNYIVDFFCKELSLIIEVDGYSHQLEKVKCKDEIKYDKLTKMNYHIIKIRDCKIFENMDLVINSINNVIKKISHLPSPPQGGDLFLI